MLKLEDKDQERLIAYVKEVTGITLDRSKSYLLESRLGPLVEELGCKDYGDLLAKARADRTGRVKDRIIDAITTNETFFFRDTTPFELLRHKIFPDMFDRLEAAGKRTLNIWSAACSTGQEVYSIAIILRELLGRDYSKWRIKILGTDISDSAISQASYGRYNRVEVSRGLTQDQIRKYFNPDGRYWRIKDEVRGDIVFRRMNLLEPFTGLPKFEVILCRNVAIYFSPEDRKSLFRRLADQLVPGGVLLVGASESLFDLTDRFERRSHMKASYYVLKD